ncbi:MAG: MarR family winged helix-turn-helix transcriptional regulator [Rudaea sp.]
MSETAVSLRRHAWAVFLKAHARLTERVETALQRAGLPPLAWYDVLWALETVPEGRLRMNELAERVVVSRSNLSRLADRLEDGGLIRREPCAGDRRGYYCAITDAGRALRGRMWPAYRREIDRLFGRHLGNDEARVIGESLERIAMRARDDD